MKSKRLFNWTLSFPVMMFLAGFLGFAVLTCGCAQKEQTNLLGGKHGIKGSETKILKEIQSFEGLSPSSISGGSEIAFEYAPANSPQSWVVLTKSGKQKEVIPGSSPSLSEAGLFFIADPGACFIKKGKKEPQMLGLNNEFFSIAASRKGDKLILIKPQNDILNVLCLYNIKARRLKELELPQELYPDNPSWASGNEILFDAGVNYAAINDPNKLPRNIFSLRIDKGNSLPTLVLSDHFSPALSPDGRLLACLEANPERKVSSLAVYELKTLKRVAFRNVGGDNLFFEGPIAWMSDSIFAVTEVDSTPPGRSLIKTFIVDDKRRVRSSN